jgi:hypothetical protein
MHVRVRSQNSLWRHWTSLTFACMLTFLLAVLKQVPQPCGPVKGRTVIGFVTWISVATGADFRGLTSSSELILPGLPARASLGGHQSSGWIVLALNDIQYQPEKGIPEEATRWSGNIFFSFHLTRFLFKHQSFLFRILASASSLFF